MALGLDGRFLYRDIYLSNVFGIETPLSGQAIKELYESTVQDLPTRSSVLKKKHCFLLVNPELYFRKAP